VRIPSEAIERFYRGERNSAVRFTVNDSVRITSGEHEGRTGAVISIVAMEPQVTLLVEPSGPPYGDLHVAQPDLEFA
jgi:transcription antitermination factor NusG